MGQRYRRVLIVSALFFIPFFSFSKAAVSANENAFTAEVARSFSTMLPEANVSIKGPLSLLLTIPGEDQAGSGWQVNLDRIWAYCGRNPSDCQRSITEYVARTAQMRRQQNLPVERQKVMAVIRSERAVQEMRDEFPIQPLAERVVGDLWFVCVVDGEPAARVLGERDLTKTGLSKAEVIALAKTNLTAHLPPISRSLNIAPDGAFGFVGGEAYYAASRLLLHDQWAELARSLKGQLLVTAPDGGVIFFADSAKPIAVQALFKASAETARRSERPISPAILVWTLQGWQEWKS
jgi:uncharacterized protein YtpQ (UPF0354 family)